MSVPERDLISYGPDANCVLDKSSPYYCPATAGVYGYRPSLAANSTFLALFALILAFQTYQYLRHRTHFFSIAMLLGCLCEIAGYTGRILLYQNPFSFTGFMLQITTITLGPAFFSAAIYFTLAQIVVYLGREHSRLPPSAYYYIFISCDLISLALQGTGGGLSSTSSGNSTPAVAVSIAGLSFQVFTITVFIILSADFAIRYSRASDNTNNNNNNHVLTKQFKMFIFFLSLAIILILVRCGYRIAELKGGYRGPGSELIRDETLFIVLEGVMVILAACVLCVAHPGRVFGGSGRREDEEKEGGCC